MKHRKVRHHEERIRWIGELFEADGALAARIHIIQDLKEEGGTIASHFPIDQKDHEGMGLF